MPDIAGLVLSVSILNTHPGQLAERISLSATSLALRSKTSLSNILVCGPQERPVSNAAECTA